MIAVLDTSAYVLADTGRADAIGALERAGELWMPVVVYGELYAGFRQGSRFDHNWGRLNRFLAEFDVPLIEVSASVAQAYGDVLLALRKKGRPIPTNDLWIAACCLSVRGTLLSSDRHFQDVDGLPVHSLRA
jgi:tRNA(fMet)-specific endonuclease VapC